MLKSTGLCPRILWIKVETADLPWHRQTRSRTAFHPEFKDADGGIGKDYCSVNYIYLVGFWPGLSKAFSIVLSIYCRAVIVDLSGGQQCNHDLSCFADRSTGSIGHCNTSYEAKKWGIGLSQIDKCLVVHIFSALGILKVRSWTLPVLGQTPPGLSLAEPPERVSFPQ